MSLALARSQCLVLPQETFTPRESPARLNAGWARWLWVGTRPTVRSRGHCDPALPSQTAQIGGGLLFRGCGVDICGVFQPESTQGLSLGYFH